MHEGIGNTLVSSYESDAEETHPYIFCNYPTDDETAGVLGVKNEGVGK